MFLSWVAIITRDPHSLKDPHALRPLRELYWPHLQRLHGRMYAFHYEGMPSGETGVIFPAASQSAAANASLQASGLASGSRDVCPMALAVMTKEAS